jgi:hypothetical protein
VKLKLAVPPEGIVCDAAPVGVNVKSGAFGGAAITVMSSELETLAIKFRSPVYCIASVCTPGARLLVVNVAGLDALKSVAAPSFTVRVPVGVPAVVGVALAVSVSGAPALIDVADGVSVETVGAGAMVTLAGMAAKL